MKFNLPSYLMQRGEVKNSKWTLLFKGLSSSWFGFRFAFNICNLTVLAIKVATEFYITPSNKIIEEGSA
jgi:hypothetical protein